MIPIRRTRSPWERSDEELGVIAPAGGARRAGAAGASPAAAQGDPFGGPQMAAGPFGGAAPGPMIEAPPASAQALSRVQMPTVGGPGGAQPYAASAPAQPAQPAQTVGGAPGGVPGGAPGPMPMRGGLFGRPNAAGGLFDNPLTQPGLGGWWQDENGISRPPGYDPANPGGFVEGAGPLPPTRGGYVGPDQVDSGDPFVPEAPPEVLPGTEQGQAAPFQLYSSGGPRGIGRLFQYGLGAVPQYRSRLREALYGGMP